MAKPKINKEQIVYKLSKKIGMPVYKTKDIVEAFLDIMVDALVDYRAIVFTGLFTIKNVSHKKVKSVDPKGGVVVRPRSYLSITPGDTLKRKLGGVPARDKLTEEQKAYKTKQATERNKLVKSFDDKEKVEYEKDKENKASWKESYDDWD